MELEVLDHSGLPPGALLSVASRPTRRQQVLPCAEPFKLQACPWPLRLDVFTSIGRTKHSASLRELDQDGCCRLPLSSADGRKMSLTLQVGAATPGPAGGAADPFAAADAEGRPPVRGDVSSYFERHGLQEFIRENFSLLLRDRPSDPYAFLAARVREAAALESQLLKVQQPSEGSAAPARRQLQRKAQLQLRAGLRNGRLRSSLQRWVEGSDDLNSSSEKELSSGLAMLAMPKPPVLVLPPADAAQAAAAARAAEQQRAAAAAEQQRAAAAAEQQRAAAAAEQQRRQQLEEATRRQEAEWEEAQRASRLAAQSTAAQKAATSVPMNQVAAGGRHDDFESPRLSQFVPSEASTTDTPGNAVRAEQPRPPSQPPEAAAAFAGSALYGAKAPSSAAKAQSAASSQQLTGFMPFEHEVDWPPRAPQNESTPRLLNFMPGDTDGFVTGFDSDAFSRSGGGAGHWAQDGQQEQPALESFVRSGSLLTRPLQGVRQDEPLPPDLDDFVPSGGGLQPLAPPSLEEFVPNLPLVGGGARVAAGPAEETTPRLLDMVPSAPGDAASRGGRSGSAGTPRLTQFMPSSAAAAASRAEASGGEATPRLTALMPTAGLPTAPVTVAAGLGPPDDPQLWDFMPGVAAQPTAAGV